MAEQIPDGPIVARNKRMGALLAGTGIYWLQGPGDIRPVLFDGDPFDEEEGARALFLIPTALAQLVDTASDSIAYQAVMDLVALVNDATSKGYRDGFMKGCAHSSNALQEVLGISQIIAAIKGLDCSPSKS